MKTKKTLPRSLALRALAALAALAALLALSGCGKTGSSGTPAGASGATAAQAGGTGASGGGDVLLSREDGETVFRVSPEFRLEADSWMGVVPAGKVYATEPEADEDDITYVYPGNYWDKPAGEPYEFRFSDVDIEWIEDGEYAMVLCDGDEEGAVILQFPITIKGAAITPDFSKLRVN